MRIKVRLGVALIVGLAALAGPVAAASAAAVSAANRPAPGKYLEPTAKTALAEWGYLRQRATDRCLEERPVREVGTGSLPCRLDNDQTWQWQSLGGPYWQLVNRSTGDCLDGSAFRVYANPCNGGAYQVWLRREDGLIVHNQSGRVLDGNTQGQAYLHEYNDGPFQKWY